MLPLNFSGSKQETRNEREKEREGGNEKERVEA